MAELLKGAPVAAALTAALAERTARLISGGVAPTLAILRVGERPDDLAYERGAMKRCEKVGVRVVHVVLPADCTQDALLAEIEKINADAGIHGCLMFRPLPKHIDESAVCEALAPEKDVDCMTAVSLNTVFTGRGRGFAPCTAQSCIEILDHYGIDPAGKSAAVVGRSLVIGKPVSMMLQSRNATVTMCHTKTVDLPTVCRRAEILVVAAGKAGVVGAAFTNPDQVVIDVGINPAPGGSICGDVQFDAVEPLVRAIAPVPGGVGAVTTAVLCKHVVEAAERAAAAL
ncbi:MAG: bifunctional 5,10-methylene-tetrahydrofolate dehydrogenase/5,10-methylene-tetrahydrofolate cyclohydrolase [Oscillospiraceae bacterium]|nr:bifunctional 5,10-methylene-tetrahydrofolate dehydrogenase/5,10-methylene-tetrahydrofolate cyclohydrolase [Oscillospiraceae bacterium]